jgi:hypothetical protein
LIEQEMVRRMIVRAMVVGPVIIGALWLAGGGRYGLSAAAGIAMTLGNLYLSARIVGGVAERSPQLLVPAALITLALGLALLTATAVALRALDLVYFPVTGFALIGSHLLLVLWEAGEAYGHLDKPPSSSTKTPIRTRS